MENKINLKTKAYYTNIIGIEFSPTVLLYSLNVAVVKGSRYWWRFLGLIPLIPKIAKEDLYERFYFGSTIFSSKYTTIKKINDRLWSHKFATKDGVYQKPYVVIFREGGDNEQKYFDNDKEARLFMEDIKSKCKEYGNILS